MTLAQVSGGSSGFEPFPHGIRLKITESTIAEKNPIGQNQSENQSG